ncbi:hypothetical protein BDW74DRAFT_172183 [Aspergillus multicolor]|uniref:uncharacterized protein n=1 Tax=Aspergillus multicolor TaxID=41759 RepID=UPI003CCD4D0A
MFQWPGVPLNDDDIDVPRFLDKPIRGIPRSDDGKLCLQDPCCGNVCRRIGSMATHYKKVHDISMADAEKAYRLVSFQQLFTMFAGSHYIPVISRIEEIDASHCTSADLHPEHFIQYTTDKIASDDTALKDTMSQGTDSQEPITWMDKTQWDKYLQGVHLPDLLETVAAPAEDTSEQSERAMHMIWDAVDQVIQQSQMVVQTCGVDVPVTAARLNKCKIPLNTCMDRNGTRRAVRLWQEVVVCLGRIMNGGRWREAKPEIMFTEAQRVGWKRLWLSAQGEAVAKQAESSIEHRRHNVYEHALVCAMGVQGYEETEWRRSEAYTRMLSELIQIAQFLVVYNAFCISSPDRENIFQSQGNYPDRSAGTAMAASCSVSDNLPASSSPSTVLPPSNADGVDKKSPGFRDSLAWAVHRLISDQWIWPMDILLDWQSFGLKIGDFQWHDPNTLFYRQVKFTVDELRGLVYRLVRMAQNKLDWAIGGSDTIWPVIPWSRLHEDALQDTPGRSFLQHGETPWPVDGATWLSNRLSWDPQVHDLQQPRETKTQFELPEYSRILLAIKGYHQGVDDGLPDNVPMEPPEDAAMHPDDPDPEHRGTVGLDALHSPHIASPLYAREICDGQLEEKRRKRQKLRAASTNWHRFLGFPSAKAASVLGKRAAAPCEADEDMSQMASRQRVRGVDEDSSIYSCNHVDHSDKGLAATA